MPSVQLRGYRHSVHTVGITASGVLYVDIQKFAEDFSEYATTYYVRVADVARIKRLISRDRTRPISDLELLRLFAASFHTADYVLDWLLEADVRVIRRHDEGACLNAEEGVPEAALTHASPPPIVARVVAHASRGQFY